MALGFSQISTVVLLGLLNVAVIFFVISFSYLGNLVLIGSLVGLGGALGLVLRVGRAPQLPSLAVESFSEAAQQ